MSISKKLIPIKNLKPGMISTKDINFHGTLLLAKDSPFTESVIKTLIGNYIFATVEIYSDKETTAKDLSFKLRNTDDLDKSFDNFSKSLEKLFDNISTVKFNGMEELRIFSKQIQNEYISTNTVIKDLVFYNYKNHNIYRHSINVAALSYILGKWLGFNETELNLLNYSAILHDLGKAKFGLDQPKNSAHLTLKERKALTMHPIEGYNLIKTIPYLDSSVALGVLMHHERIDGSGYPLGIKGNKIHKFSKVIAITELFEETVANNRKNITFSPLDALELIRKESYSTLEKNYCNMFINHISNFCSGEYVVLNDNRHCKFIKANNTDLANPLVLYKDSFIDLREEPELAIKNFII